MKRIAILITCFNRKEKTVNCFESIQKQVNDLSFEADIYLVDDGTDGTGHDIKGMYPDTDVAKGTGALYWAGGMRQAWKNAIDSNVNYHFFLLINDDTVLVRDAIESLLRDHEQLNQDAILVGSTSNINDNQISYGGSILSNKYNLNSEVVLPNNQFPQLCDLGNANIMFIPFSVYEKVGILSEGYTHAIADYEYTLKARKAGVKSFVASQVLGYCINDHGVSWKSFKGTTLKQRIEYLYHVKGLAYNEYLLFIRAYFPFYLPEAWLKLWLKTFFPFLWDKFKPLKERI